MTYTKAGQLLGAHDRGKLKCPSLAVKRLCVFAEKVFRNEFPDNVPKPTVTVSSLLHKLLNFAPKEALFLQPSGGLSDSEKRAFLAHMAEVDSEDKRSHRSRLVTLIATRYFEVRLNYFYREFILNQKAETSLRHKLKKRIHQAGQ